MENDYDDDISFQDTVYPTVVEAATLHRQGGLGRGVTVAVVDSGLSARGSGWNWIEKNTTRDVRILATFDAITGIAGGDIHDDNGHGTHVVNVLASSRKSTGAKPRSYNGIAPDADLVIVKAFDAQGHGRYLDVIRGIDFVVANKDAYGIRVLNLSFGGTPQSHYWDDPLNQAVMAAWQAGIVVVASAGNQGPDPMTIGVPGNVPYVVTVGAISDAVTEDADDDFLTTFSGAGPTFEGFVKPEIVAPGGHVLAQIDPWSWLAQMFLSWLFGDDYFHMSGTSQSAAIVPGTVALMLEADPWLTPDEVKCRLMDSARPAVNAQGQLAY
ncbi:MAG: S8 family peptidase, partial [bacterium]|nr:S8 family peptidase [bacterium]